MSYGIIELLTALGIGGVLSKIVTFWIDSIKRKRKNEDGFSRLLNDTHKVYITLNTLLASSNFHRVLILKTENGGGRPRLGATLKSSILFEVHAVNETPLKPSWQNQLIDDPYLRMLHEVDTRSQLVVSTVSMSPGMLKDIFHTNDIKQSCIVKICERPGDFIYMSIDCIKEIDFDHAEMRDKIRSTVTNLNSIFTNNLKI